jgi:pyruvate ferredoxin oxidoreductase delta subunit
MTEEGYYEVDLYHCKGCGICAHECRKGAIRMVEEGE